MSIATELAKLQTARNKIRTKLVALGLVAAAAKLDDCATAVDGISNQGAVSATVQEGDTYTIPAGYHNGSGTVSGVAGGGNYKLQSKTVAPTKAQQAITPDSGYYGLSDVTVSQIPDAYQDVSSVTAGAASASLVLTHRYGGRSLRLTRADPPFHSGQPSPLRRARLPTVPIFRVIKKARQAAGFLFSQ